MHISAIHQEKSFQVHLGTMLPCSSVLRAFPFMNCMWARQKFSAKLSQGRVHSDSYNRPTAFSVSTSGSSYLATRMTPHSTPRPFSAYSHDRITDETRGESFSVYFSAQNQVRIGQEMFTYSFLAEAKAPTEPTWDFFLLIWFENGGELVVRSYLGASGQPALAFSVLFPILVWKRFRTDR